MKGIRLYYLFLLFSIAPLFAFNSNCPEIKAKEENLDRNDLAIHLSIPFFESDKFDIVPKGNALINKEELADFGLPISTDCRVPINTLGGNNDPETINELDLLYEEEENVYESPYSGTEISQTEKTSGESNWICTMVTPELCMNEVNNGFRYFLLGKVFGDTEWTEIAYNTLPNFSEKTVDVPNNSVYILKIEVYNIETIFLAASDELFLPNYTCSDPNECPEPKVVAQPEDKSVCEGEQVKFKFDVEGFGDHPRCIWFKDGSITGYGGTLTIENVSTADEGIYYCQVIYECEDGTNKFLHSKDVDLFVETKPVVKAGLGGIINLEESFTLNGSITGGTNPIWSPSSTLTFPNGPLMPLATPTENTTYTLSASNNGCVASDKVTITVLDIDCTNLTFSKQPSNKSICNTESVTLTVDGPEHTYIWYRTNQTGSMIFEEVGQGKSAFIVNPINGTYYTCFMYCSSSEVKSNTVLITVTPYPTVNAGLDITISTDGELNGWVDPSPDSFEWSPDIGISSIFILNPDVYPTTTTTYTLTARINGCEASDDVRVTIDEPCDPPPPFQISDQPQDVEICVGENAEFSVDSPQGLHYKWRRTNATGSSLFEVVGTEHLLVINNVSESLNGNFYLCEIIDGCDREIKSAVVELTVNDKPFVSAGADVHISLGGSTPLDGVAATDAAFEWSPDDNTLSNIYILNPDANPNSTKTYTLTAVRNGCRNSDDVIVSVGDCPPPILTTHPSNTAVCEDTDVVFRVEGPSGHIYRWYKADAQGNAQGSSIGDGSTLTLTQVDTDLDDSYYVCYVENEVTACYTYSNKAKLTVDTKPEVHAGPDKTIPVNGQVDLEGTSSSSSFSWSPNSADLLTNPVSLTPTAHPNTTQTYTLTAFDNTCQASDDVIVNVQDVDCPAISFAGQPSNKAVCEGADAHFSVSGSNSYTYAWYRSNASGDPSGSSIGSGKTLTLSNVSLGQNASYYRCYATYFNTDHACLSYIWSNTVKLTVNSIPTVNAGSDKTITAGDTITLNGVGSVDATFKWSPSTGLDNPFELTTDAFPTSSQIYTLEANRNGCTITDNVFVEVLIDVTCPPVTFDQEPSNTSACEGQNAQFSVLGSSTFSYAWYQTDAAGDPSGSTVITTGKTLNLSNVSPDDNNTYYRCYASYDDGSCSNYLWSKTVKLTVFGSITVYAGPDKTITTGQKAILEGSRNPEVAFTWTPSNYLLNPNDIRPTAEPPISTIFTLTATNGDCSVSDKVQVIVNDAPLICDPIIINGQPSDAQICEGEDATFTVVGSDNYDYFWYNTDATGNKLNSTIIGTSKTLTRYDVKIFQDGYYFRCFVQDECGKSKGSNTVQLQVKRNPVANAGSDKSITIGESVILNGSTSVGSSPSWSPTTHLTFPNGPTTPSASPEVPTVYTLTATIDGCTHSDGVKVDVEIPDADCPDYGLNFGDSCKADDANFINYTLREPDCECIGKDRYDCPDLELNIGDTCQPDDANGVNYTVKEDCSCEGTPLSDLPKLSVESKEIPENIGIVSIEICLSSTPDSDLPVSVFYSTESGTAGHSYNHLNYDVDYEQGILRFEFGQTCQTIDIQVLNDDIEEADEYFYIDLDDPVNATFEIEKGTIVILNDDCSNGVVGAACDDGQIGTINDVIQTDCTCKGNLTDCIYEGQGYYIGDSCNDNNPYTLNDKITSDCKCEGTPIYCENLDLDVGESCNDGSSQTLYDVVTIDCECKGCKGTYWAADFDGDGYEQVVFDCYRPGAGWYAYDHTNHKPDCNDSNPNIHTPQYWYIDGDGDGWAYFWSRYLSCNRPGGNYLNASELAGITDCNDEDPTINPGVEEICDGIDNNCDGKVDRFFSWFAFQLNSFEARCEAFDPAPISFKVDPLSNYDLSLLSYKWEKTTGSPGSGANWEEIPGATEAVYDPPFITETTYYRCLTRDHLDCYWHPSNNYAGKYVDITEPEIETFTICFGDTLEIPFDETPPNPPHEVFWSPNSNIFFDTLLIPIEDPTIYEDTSKNNNGDTLNQILYDTIIRGPLVAPVESRTISVQIRSYYNCSIYKQYKIRVLDDGGEIAGNQLVCKGTQPEAIISNAPAFSGEFNASYYWEYSYDNSQWQILENEVGESLTPIISPNQKTTYFRRLATSEDCTDPIYSNTVAIQNREDFEVEVYYQEFCYEHPGLLNAIMFGGSGNYTFDWTSPGGFVIFDDPTIQKPTITIPIDAPATNQILLNVTDNDYGCTTSYTTNITIDPGCKCVEVKLNNDSFCYEMPILLDVVYTEGSGDYTYAWTNNYNFVTFDDPTIANPTIQIAPVNFTNFQLVLDVYDNVYKCSKRFSKIIQIGTECECNTFATDNDGDGVCNVFDLCHDGDDNIDVDMDGIPDDCDDCISDTPDLDTDEDGTPDCMDECPDNALLQIKPDCGCGLQVVGTQIIDEDGNYYEISELINKDTSMEDHSKVTLQARDRIQLKPGFRFSAEYQERLKGFIKDAYITFYEPITDAGEIRYSDTICFDATQATIENIELATPEDGLQVRYKWQFSVDELDWEDVPNSNDTNFLMVDLEVIPIYYRRMAAVENCEEWYPSNNVLISKYPEVIVDAGNHQEICAGVCVDLFATDNGNYTYLWSPGGYTTQAINVCPTETTVYRVTATDEHGCSAIDFVEVVVNELPDIAINAFPSAIICVGDTTQLSVPNGYTYHWSNGATSSEIEVSPTSSTIYTITVTDNKNCSSIEQIEIIVNDLPNITITALPNDSICHGDSVLLTAQGGTLFRWSDGTIGASTKVSPRLTSTYLVTVTDDNTCADTSSIVIPVKENPPGVIHDIDTLCHSTQKILTAHDGTAYLWHTGETSQSILITAVKDTIYYVKVYKEDSCPVAEAFPIYVPPTLPNLGLQKDTICPEVPFSLTAADGGVTYLWSTNVANDQRTLQNPSVTILEDATFTVTISDDFGCLIIDTTQLTTLPSVPDLLLGEDLTLCSGSSFTLRATDDGLPLKYLWSTGDTTNRVDITIDTLLGIWVTVTNPDGGCFKQDTVVFNVVEADSFEYTICKGEVLPLSAPYDDNSMYTWFPSAGLNDTTIANPLASPDTTTIYTFIYENVGLNCLDTLTYLINVDYPVYTLKDTAIWKGGSVLLEIPAGNQILWSTGETTNNLWVTPDTTTVYTVEIITPTNCVILDTIKVSVSRLMVYAGRDQDFCKFDPATKAAYQDILYEFESIWIDSMDYDSIAFYEILADSLTIKATGADSYLWNTGHVTDTFKVCPTQTTTYIVTGMDTLGFSQMDTVVITPVTPDMPLISDTTIYAGDTIELIGPGDSDYLWNIGEHANSITVSPTTGMEYFYLGTSSNGCITVGQINVHIKLDVDAGETQSICPGETAMLTATGAEHYVWMQGPDTLALGATITVSPTSTTVYQVTGWDAHGNRATDAVTIFIQESPEITISGNTDICLGDSTTLVATGGSSYLWNGTDTTASITISPNNSASYILVTSDDLGCTSSDTIQVTVTNCDTTNSLVLHILKDTTICIGEEVTLTATGGTNYTWSTGTQGESITVNPLETTTYSVTATDGDGATGFAEATVTIIDLALEISDPFGVCAGEPIMIDAYSPIADTYIWNTGETTSMLSVSPTETTTYTVTASGGGCTQTASTIITILADSVMLEPVIRLCAGDTTTLMATGGVEYEWTLKGETEILDTTAFLTISPDADTDYQVKITSANGCMGVSEYPVIVLPEILLSLDSINPTCDNNQQDGQILITSPTTINGFALEFSQEANGPYQTQTSFDTLSAGIYTIYARYVLDTTCMDSLQIELLSPTGCPCTLGITAEITPPSCPDSTSNGLILLLANVNDPIEYQLNGGSWIGGTDEFDNLAPGDYVINAQLVNDPSCNTSILVTLPAPDCRCDTLFPSLDCNASLTAGDISIIGFDNDIGGDVDQLMITNLVDLAQGATFSIATAIYGANAAAGEASEQWLAPDGSTNIAMQTIVYNGEAVIPAGSVICFELPASTDPAYNFMINGTESLDFCAFQTGLTEGVVNLSTATPTALFIMDGVWADKDTHASFCGSVLSGLMSGGSWIEGTGAVNNGNSRVHPHLDCFFIQGVASTGTDAGYYDGTPPPASDDAFDILSVLTNYEDWSKGAIPGSACSQTILLIGN